MTQARTHLVDIDATPYYHCIARCVRRAWLCGEDHATGRNFDHRKAWVIERLGVLTSVFTIDVCAYAAMSNHLHLVLHVDRERARSLGEQEVLSRVRTLFPSAMEDSEGWTPEEQSRRVALWRERLWSVSWFMRGLSEFIARRGNREDGCTGRFWEGRFRSQALLDDGALLACMSYVDLNPVRAGAAQGLQDSVWTSIHQRLLEASAEEAGVSETADPTALPAPAAVPAEAEEQVPVVSPLAAMCGQPKLAAFAGATRDLSPVDKAGLEPLVLPIRLNDYVELLEWTGRVARDQTGGRDALGAQATGLLRQSGLNPDTWLDSLGRFGDFAARVGAPQRLREHAVRVGRRWLRGQQPAQRMYQKAA